MSDALIYVGIGPVPDRCPECGTNSDNQTKCCVILQTKQARIDRLEKALELIKVNNSPDIVQQGALYKGAYQTAKEALQGETE